MGSTQKKFTTGEYRSQLPSAEPEAGFVNAPSGLVDYAGIICLVEVLELIDRFFCFLLRSDGWFRLRPYPSVYVLLATLRDEHRMIFVLPLYVLYVDLVAIE